MSPAPTTSKNPHEVPNHTEALRVASAKAGDDSCFEDLVRGHEAKIIHLAFSITGNREDAEDAMQTAFMKAHQRINQFRGDSLFSTWLTRIAVNEALMQVRRRRAPQLSLDDSPKMAEPLMIRDIQPWERSPEQHCEQAELRRIINKALGELGRNYRFVFVLRHIENLSTSETAYLLGLSPSLVKSRLSQARLKLRSAMNRHFRKKPKRFQFPKASMVTPRR